MKKLILSLSILGMIFSMTQALTASWTEADPQVIRKKINQCIDAIEAPVPAVFSIKNKTISTDVSSIPLRIYLPSKETHLPVIMLIHGGAWVGGNLDTHDNLARYLCAESGAVVVSIDYLNAPEGKFPIQLNQCYATLKWIQDHSQELGIDNSKIIVAGDSAGGNMAASLCLMVRDQGGPKIRLQVLINPAVDLSYDDTLEKQNDQLEMFRWIVTQYVENVKDVEHPYVSPLKAKDLHDLPAAVILVAELDELRFSAEQYSKRLTAAGVSTFLYCQPEVDHLAGHGAKASFMARKTLDVAVKRIKKTCFEEIKE